MARVTISKSNNSVMHPSTIAKENNLNCKVISSQMHGFGRYGSMTFVIEGSRDDLEKLLKKMRMSSEISKIKDGRFTDAELASLKKTIRLCKDEVMNTRSGCF